MYKPSDRVKLNKTGLIVYRDSSDLNRNLISAEAAYGIIVYKAPDNKSYKIDWYDKDSIRLPIKNIVMCSEIFLYGIRNNFSIESIIENLEKLEKKYET